MFIGHAAVALAAKPLAPRTSLAVLLMAAFWVDMVWPGSDTMIGFGLWNSVPATMIVECAMFAAGVAIYARSAPSRDRVGTWAFWGLVGFLLLAYLGNVFGPPPPNVQAIAIAGIAGSALFTAWSWWADRHRGARTQ